jgi:hypothetical protein
MLPCQLSRLPSLVETDKRALAAAQYVVTNCSQLPKGNRLKKLNWAEFDKPRQ